MVKAGAGAGGPGSASWYGLAVWDVTRVFSQGNRDNNLSFLCFISWSQVLVEELLLLHCSVELSIRSEDRRRSEC